MPVPSSLGAFGRSSDSQGLYGSPSFARVIPVRPASGVASDRMASGFKAANSSGVMHVLCCKAASANATRSRMLATRTGPCVVLRARLARDMCAEGLSACSVAELGQRSAARLLGRSWLEFVGCRAPRKPRSVLHPGPTSGILSNFSSTSALPPASAQSQMSQSQAPSPSQALKAPQSRLRAHAVFPFPSRPEPPARSGEPAC